jgi:hypothetical protein
VKHALIPAHFQEVCEKEVWNDGFGSEALTLLSDCFVVEVAACSEDEIQQAALQWAAMFPYLEALEQRPAYRSVVQLREVACDVVAKKKALLLYLAGAPGFFEYLRDR